MANKHESVFKNDTISLSKGQDGYWLYDHTRGMNLAMRAKSEQEAFIEAIMYYQKRLLEVEKELKDINAKVDMFVSLVCPLDDDN